MIEILLALLAGVLTIAAPCILLPLPILLGSAIKQQNKTRPLFITLGFVITFSLLALSLNFLIQTLGLSPNALRNIAAVVLFILGLFMILPSFYEKLTLKFSPLINKAGSVASKNSQSSFGGFITGVVIGIVWAPCAGPILGSILTLIARQENLISASILLFAYSVGAGIPMLIISYGGQIASNHIKPIARYSTLLQQIFGIIIVCLAVAIFFQYDTYLQAKLIEFLPFLTPKF